MRNPNGYQCYGWKQQIYFQWSMRQRKKFHSLGYEYNRMELIPMSDFLKITKKKRHIEILIGIKRNSMRIAA
jgi:hypothetical protein